MAMGTPNNLRNYNEGIEIEDNFCLLRSRVKGQTIKKYIAD